MSPPDMDTLNYLKGLYTVDTFEEPEVEVCAATW